jgi:hypothetical protein
MPNHDLVAVWEEHLRSEFAAVHTYLAQTGSDAVAPATVERL